MPDKDTLGGIAVRLARDLPDIPRWIETRSMLLSGDCEVFGLEQGGSDFVVRDPELISVVGHPSWAAIREAASRGWVDLLAFPENRVHVFSVLPGWTDVRATLHMLGNAHRLPEVPEGSVRQLAVSEINGIEGLPSHLCSELELAARESLIVTVLEDERPVSFCYAGARTETLWDISIDTLEGYRNQGHAARCVAYMVEHMRQYGKQPVWAAEQSNAPSLGLAAKLGFVPVDELIVFHPPRNQR